MTLASANVSARPQTADDELRPDAHVASASQPPPGVSPTRLQPTSGWAAIDLREAWRYRDLLRTLAVRDVKVRYKQTLLGVVWVIFQPLVAALIFSFVFGRVAKIPAPQGVPQILFIFAAITGFDLFRSTTLRSSQSMLSNANLVSKVYFPRVLLPISSAASSLLDYAVSFSVLLVMWVLIGLFTPSVASQLASGTAADAVLSVPTPGWSLLLFPVCMALLLMTSLGLGMMATSLAVFYRDVGHIVPVLIMLMMYASPVMYDLGIVISDDASQIPTWIETIYLLNPMAGLISAYRWSLLGAGTVHWGAFAWSAVFACGAMLVGTLIFKRMERRFSDVI